MGAEEKNRNQNLSRIAADLFVKSKGGVELSNKIQRLHDEIKKAIESGNTIFGKFRELVESFEEIIPEEKQRYHAAFKALSTTSKLSRQEIVKAVNNQLEELKILEKGIIAANPGWRDELNAMEVKSRGMRDEIAKLREKLGLLESEEKEVISGMAARKMEMELIENAVGKLFTDLGAEITNIKKRIEEFTAENAAPQPTPPMDSPQSYTSSEEKGSGGQKSEILESSPPQDTQYQKKCPMCGGRMSFHMLDEIWTCYSCAYEESKTGEAQGKSEEKRERVDAPDPDPAPESLIYPTQTLADSLASLPSNEHQKSKKGSSPFGSQPSGKKKTCPVCRKKMDWFELESAWRCPFCDYERSI